MSENTLSGTKTSTSEDTNTKELFSHKRDRKDKTYETEIFSVFDYRELEKRNLEIKKAAEKGTPESVLKEKLIANLKEEKGIKAITIAFCDLEGKLHTLDYDKNYFLDALDNLTLDGSSIKGFTELKNSDLRLQPDWKSFRYLPADIFGAGKGMMFGFLCNEDGSFFPSDFRGQLQQFTEKLAQKKITAYGAPEIEGFLLRGTNAEQHFDQIKGFELVTEGGYFSTLPQDEMRLFIDKVAEVQRALAFENEKDHGEVAPSTFEINFRYTEVLTMCDQMLIYKLTARQVAKLMGFTASFLPKPVAGISGSGMHMNISLGNEKNLFWDAQDKEKISPLGKKFIAGILHYASELCLTICPSVNSYRRLDPHFEAPNEIKYSMCDRTSMIRIPLGNERSSRVEVRSVSPDVNPYLALYTLLKAGLSGIEKDIPLPSGTPKTLWGNIQDAINSFENSAFMKDILGKTEHEKYLNLKKNVANRSPLLLGKKIKQSEIIHHHEITNQMLWSDF